MEFIGGDAPVGNFLALDFVFKVVFFVILFGYVFYAFLITLRIRILSDTVRTKHNKFAASIAYVHALVALIGSFLALLVILLA